MAARKMAVMHLKEMFPALPERNIKAALFSSDGDINGAADWLLTQGLASAPLSSSASTILHAPVPLVAPTSAAIPQGYLTSRSGQQYPGAFSGQGKSINPHAGPVVSSLMDAPMLAGHSTSPLVPPSFESFVLHPPPRATVDAPDMVAVQNLPPTQQVAPPPVQFAGVPSTFNVMDGPVLQLPVAEIPVDPAGGPEIVVAPSSGAGADPAAGVAAAAAVTPTAGVTPAAGAGPTVDAAPAAGPTPAAGSAPEADAAPVAGAALEAGAAPEDDAAPIAGAAPAGGLTPAAGSAPEADAAPAASAALEAGSAPEDDAAPIAGAFPTAGAALAAGATPTAGAGPAADATHVAGVTPTAGAIEVVAALGPAAAVGEAGVVKENPAAEVLCESEGTTPELEADSAPAGGSAPPVHTQNTELGVVVQPSLVLTGSDWVDSGAVEELLPPSKVEVEDGCATEDTPTDWVLTPENVEDGGLKEAGGVSSSSKDPGDGDKVAEVLAEVEDPLSWSVMSGSVLGSRLDVSAFSPDAFDALLQKSSGIKTDLKGGIQVVHELRTKLEQKEAENERVETQLASGQADEEGRQKKTEFMLQQARDELDDGTSELAGEKATLHFEARQLVKRLGTLDSTKSALEGDLEELKDVLLEKIQKMEEKIQLATKEMADLVALRESREELVAAEMADIVARQKALEDERAACHKLKEFLTDRCKMVDTIEGGVMQCSDEIKRLRRAVLGAPGLEGVDELPSQLSWVGMPSANTSVHSAAEDVESDHPAGSLASSRVAMKEVLQGLFSSPEGSTGGNSAAGSSHCSSPALYASAEALATDPKQAALEMLSLMRSRSGSSEGRVSKGSGADNVSEVAGPFPVVPSEPVVRVFEDDVDPGVGNASGEGNSVASSSPERDDGWEDVTYPQVE